MQTRVDEYIACDTIYYPGANCTQTQMMHYMGDRTVKATTGETMSCSGKNNLKPLNVIYHPFIGAEIADVNLKPYATCWNYFNPLLRVYTNISWAKNYCSGIHVQPSENPSPESVAFHGPNLSKMSYGQTSDIESHHKKYQLWQQNKTNDSLILYGVSRGTAATSAAFSIYQYPEVKLVILEGAVDSMDNVITSIMRHRLHFDRLVNAAIAGVRSTVDWLNRHGMFGYNKDDYSPLGVLDQFPANVPVVYITSEKDTVVYPENTRNIATRLAQRGKNDVYLLQLKNSSHPRYMYDDEEDRNQYEAFIHAIYKKYGLQHDETLAQKGAHLIEQCCLAKANENLPVAISINQ